LSSELKELEMNKIVVRKADDDSGAVEYEITQYCSSFDVIIHAMIDWGKRHRKYLAEN
jgi:DNA-binding HxlR family transcriptional regulator